MEIKDLYDIVIIGGGPAGLTAAIYAARAELSTLVLEKEPMCGGQIINTYEVDNYPGIPGISGFALAEKFKEHCDRLGAVFGEGEIESIDYSGKNKKIILKDGTILMTKCIIISTGAAYRKLGVKGEEEFAGMGVSYCATCDGAFFRNKDTMVVGGGDVAVEDAIFLARLCRKVYIVHRRDEFRAVKTLVTSLKSYENIELVMDSVVEEIQGDKMVTGAVVRNIKTEEVQTIPLSGVFIAVGNKPNSELFVPEVETDETGYLKAGEDCETNIPGVFAVGDIRTKQLRQIITASSDGANAVTSVERYINQVYK